MRRGWGVMVLWAAVTTGGCSRTQQPGEPSADGVVRGCVEGRYGCACDSERDCQAGLTCNAGLCSRSDPPPRAVSPTGNAPVGPVFPPSVDPPVPTWPMEDPMQDDPMQDPMQAPEGYCGDGIWQPEEDCDGQTTATCLTPGNRLVLLDCRPDCTIDYSACTDGTSLNADPGGFCNGAVACGWFAVTDQNACTARITRQCAECMSQSAIDFLMSVRDEDEDAGVAELDASVPSLDPCDVPIERDCSSDCQSLFPSTR